MNPSESKTVALEGFAQDVEAEVAPELLRSQDEAGRKSRYPERVSPRPARRNKGGTTEEIPFVL